MKRVSEIIADVPVIATNGNLSTLVRDIKYDSRQVEAEDMFVAIRGFQSDGHRYIESAYRSGCRVFVVEEMPDLPDAVVIHVKNTRRIMPKLARNHFSHADGALKMIGITGTNGKTTTAYLVYEILQRAGWRPGLITTVETIIAEDHQEAQRTTPESTDLHRMFYNLQRNGGKSAVMEVSSHALALHRVDGISFNGAVFTNLGHDHLDFHETMEQYFLAKAQLFSGLRQNDRAIINLDDPYGQRLIEMTDGDVFTFSMKDPSATVFIENYQVLAEGMSLTFKVPSGKMYCSTPMVGKFNIYNIMAAVATALSLGIHEEKIIQGIENMKPVPGRCERYIFPHGFQLYIDYAHTPDALQRILEALMSFNPRRLTVVFGCGGDRDRKKRPAMGKIAEDYADRVILTSDNPRSESPQAIIEEIRGGIFDQSRVEVIADRRAAIEFAMKSAIKNEIVLVAGKGHEQYQEIAGKRHYHSDMEVVRNFKM